MQCLQKIICVGLYSIKPTGLIMKFIVFLREPTDMRRMGGEGTRDVPAHKLAFTGVQNVGAHSFAVMVT